MAVKGVDSSEPISSSAPDLSANADPQGTAVEDQEERVQGLAQAQLQLDATQQAEQSEQTERIERDTQEEQGTAFAGFAGVAESTSIPDSPEDLAHKRRQEEDEEKEATLTVSDFLPPRSDLKG